MKTAKSNFMVNIAGGYVREDGWHPDCGGKLFMDTDSYPGEWIAWCDRCGYIIDDSFMD